ncbi:unnamed protein product [Prunus armeniaca]|uniref:Glycosyltransferase subfamily 4-like N-terminal domain-containing protein n=1 Tax=Prunus armeniaca TaxID=36596 RepID=A0A6J5X796_PRUAR|nr:unnamed protein product [Prunus armeniaca]
MAKKGSSKLNIAIIHPDLGIGGAERLIVDAAVELASMGIKFMFSQRTMTKIAVLRRLFLGWNVYGTINQIGVFGNHKNSCPYPTSNCNAI